MKTVVSSHLYTYIKKLKLILNLLIIPIASFLLLMRILPGSSQLSPEDKKPSLLDNPLIQKRFLGNLHPESLLHGIHPGTKWCGKGNISKSYDDLGEFAYTDSCCREHDHCRDSIEAGKTKHDLTSNSPFVSSHCDCDKKLHKCLKQSNDIINRIVSTEIGFAYFNYLIPQCFKEDYPQIRCKKYQRFAFRKRCTEYITNQKEGKIYQWFDNPFF